MQACGVVRACVPKRPHHHDRQLNAGESPCQTCPRGVDQEGDDDNADDDVVGDGSVEPWQSGSLGLRGSPAPGVALVAPVRCCHLHPAQRVSDASGRPPSTFILNVPQRHRHADGQRGSLSKGQLPQDGTRPTDIPTPTAHTCTQAVREEEALMKRPDLVEPWQWSAFLGILGNPGQGPLEPRSAVRRHHHPAQRVSRPPALIHFVSQRAASATQVGCAGDPNKGPLPQDGLPQPPLTQAHKDSDEGAGEVGVDVELQR